MVVRAGTSGRRRVKKKIKRKKSLGASAAWQAAWQGVGPFRVLALDGQCLGKLMASAWQASGKLVASGPFFWQAPVLPFFVWGEGAKTYAFLTFLVLGIPPK